MIHNNRGRKPGEPEQHCSCCDEALSTVYTDDAGEIFCRDCHLELEYGSIPGPSRITSRPVDGGTRGLSGRAYGDDEASSGQESAIRRLEDADANVA